LILVHTYFLATGLTVILSGDKRKSYLQRLEVIAMGATTAPTPPSSHNDESPAQEYPMNDYSIRTDPASHNDMSAHGGIPEPSAPSWSLTNHEVGNVLALPGCLPGFTRYDPTIGESFNEFETGGNFSGENPVFPPPTDLTVALDSDNVRAWRPSNAGQYIGGIAEFPRSHENNRQALARTPVQAPFSSNRLSSVLLSQDGVSQKYTLEDIMIAGIRALSERESHSRNDTRTNSPPITVAGNDARQNPASAANLEHCYTPDIHLNTIQLTTMSFVAACFANADMLGLSPETLWNKTSQSPFYQAQMANDAVGPANVGQFGHLKPLLRPSSTQLTHPHHPYLDILPFPAFRNRIIQLLQVQPRPIDSDKLCQDLTSDGLICWGSTKRDGRDTGGSGAPWDIRSWEIRPWFLKKWWLLFDGPDGEMYQHSRWWSELRGEKSSYPW
jgi:hypothetical protein